MASGLKRRVGILAVVVIAAIGVWFWGGMARDKASVAVDAAEVDRVVAGLQARFPALAVERRDVPDEENAYLQLYLWAEEADSDALGLSVEFKEFLWQESPPDPALARAFLAEHEESISRAEEIISLPGASSAALPWHSHIIHSRPQKEASDVFLLRAQLAAAGGDEAEALRNVRLVQTLVALHRDIEAPTFLSETVAILINASIIDRVVKGILPALGPDADVEAWRRALPLDGVSPAALARVIRGEWHSTARAVVVPAALGGGGGDDIVDPEDFLEAWTEEMAILVARLPTMSFAQVLAEDDLLRNFGERHRLSRAGRKQAEILTEGQAAWIRGYVRHAVVAGQAKAVFAILGQEAAGKPAPAGPLALCPSDLVSGQPFHFDPASRTVIAPPQSKAGDVGPLKLPW